MPQVVRGTGHGLAFSAAPLADASGSLWNLGYQPRLMFVSTALRAVGRSTPVSSM